METNEIEKLARLKKLITKHFSTLKPANTKGLYTTEIEVLNYTELGCIIINMLKLCILALDHNMQNAEEKKKQSINVSLILETVLQMFPLDEFEFLSCVGEVANEKL